MLDGRVLVAHNASFDRRVLEQAFERAGLDWPDPPVLCTVALARKCAPLVRQRKLALLADALGIEVGVVHRALPDATTCARILCALFPRLCAAAPTVADAVAALTSPRRRGRRERPEPAARRPPEDRPDLRHLPKDPGVYVFRDERGRPLYVGKSVSLRTRARAHFCAPAGWTERAEVADYQAHQLRAGRAGAGEPADQAVAPAGQQGAQAHGQVGVRAVPARSWSTRCWRCRPSPRRGTRSASGRCAGRSWPPSWPTT